MASGVIGSSHADRSIPLARNGRSVGTGRSIPLARNGRSVDTGRSIPLARDGRSVGTGRSIPLARNKRSVGTGRSIPLARNKRSVGTGRSTPLARNGRSVGTDRRGGDCARRSVGSRSGVDLLLEPGQLTFHRAEELVHHQAQAGVDHLERRQRTERSRNHRRREEPVVVRDEAGHADQAIGRDGA